MQDIKSNLAKIVAHLKIEGVTFYQQREGKNIDTNGKNDESSATKTALPIHIISNTSFVHNAAIPDEVLQELRRKKQHESYLNFPQKKPSFFHIDSDDDDTIEDA